VRHVWSHVTKICTNGASGFKTCSVQFLHTTKCIMLMAPNVCLHYVNLMDAFMQLTGQDLSLKINH
jgi:hypothetical protein